MPGTVEELIQQAKEEGLWIRSFYQNIWFSPWELEQERNQGHYLWGVESFEKVNPFSKLRQVANEVTEKCNFIHVMLDRLELDRLQKEKDEESDNASNDPDNP